MSRIDNATLLLELTTLTAPVQLRVYAVNYNVLRIMAGMGKETALKSIIPFTFSEPETYMMLVSCY